MSSNPIYIRLSLEITCSGLQIAQQVDSREVIVGVTFTNIVPMWKRPWKYAHVVICGLSTAPAQNINCALRAFVYHTTRGQGASRVEIMHVVGC